MKREIEHSYVYGVLDAEYVESMDAILQNTSHSFTAFTHAATAADLAYLQASRSRAIQQFRGEVGINSELLYLISIIDKKIASKNDKLLRYTNNLL